MADENFNENIHKENCPADKLEMLQRKFARQKHHFKGD